MKFDELFLLFLVYKKLSHTSSACFAKYQKQQKHWRTKNLSSTSLFAKDQKTATTLKNKIFFPKVILRISQLALPAFSDLPLAASQPSSLQGPASSVVISKWRNLKFDNSRQRFHLSTFRSPHKYWEISKGRVQITRHLGKTYLSYQNVSLS